MVVVMGSLFPRPLSSMNRRRELPQARLTQRAANVHRRHLTTDQRPLLALRLLSKLKREHHPQGRPNKSASKEAVSKTATLAARLVGVSTSRVERAQRVESGATDLATKVQAGEMTYSGADRILARARTRNVSAT